MAQPFTIGILRQIIDQYFEKEGEISYGKMVELLNEVAIKWHNKTVSKMEIVDKKMTAVDWFFYNLKDHEIQAQHFELYQQAKRKEKDQIETAFFEGTCDWRKPYLENMQKAEKYYNVTYKS